MNKTQFFLFLIFVILTALFSSWLLRSIEQKDKIVTHDTLINRDYYLEDFSSVIMDKTGSPYYKLISPHLDHYPVNQITKIAEPELYIYNSKEYPWKLIAKHAQITNKGNTIYFNGDVKLNKSSANSNENIVIMTDELSVFIKEQIAESDVKVTIIQGINRIQANGMKLNLENHTLELSSQVNGKYEIQR
ncbi:MAG: LPS export ABC transporter periplasmic protein LptC [Gammaproteobacteria bacterium]